MNGGQWTHGCFAVTVIAVVAVMGGGRRYMRDVTLKELYVMSHIQARV